MTEEEHIYCSRCHMAIEWGSDVEYDGSSGSPVFTHVVCPLLEGIELPDEITPDLVEHMMDRQIYVQQLAAKMKAEGLDVDSSLVRVDGHVPEGWVEVTCLDCERTAAAPASAVDPNTVAICPPCMRARQEAKAAQN